MLSDFIVRCEHDCLLIIFTIQCNPSFKIEKCKNLMLVTNIFAFSMDAEKSVAYWRKNFLQAFIMQCDIYMGCKH